MTLPSAANLAASTNPDLLTGALGPSERPGPASVEMSLDVLDSMVNDLFLVGLAMRAETEHHGDRHRVHTESVLERLDHVIARIRRSALTGTRLSHMQISIRPAAETAGQVHQPDMVALCSMPNSKLFTVDLLDAAHSATRTLLVLQNSMAPGAQPGHLTLADAPASGA